MAYINQNIIENFKRKTGPFNYEKLNNLLTSLNRNFALNDAQTCSVLIRAILDHVPPLLGCQSFDEVVNNYQWTQSHKRFMKGLLDFKNEGDDTLHTQISDRQNYLEMDNLPSSNRLNTLLQECLINGGAQLLPKTQQPRQEESRISVEIEESERVRWANFGIGNFVWSSFRLVLIIDNYKSNKPDYIRVSLLAKGNDGEWRADHYLFEGTRENPTKPDELYHIKPNEVKQIPVFISDTGAQFNNTQNPMPDIDHDTLQLIITTKSGKEITIQIKVGLITQG